MYKVIDVSGTHGIGKSTLSKHLKSILENAGLNIEVPDYGKDENGINYSSAERRSDALGFPINKNVTFETEYQIFLATALADVETRKRAELNGSDYCIFDRGIFDLIPYSYASFQRGSITSEQFAMLESLILRHWKLYPVDIIINPSRFDDIEEDGVRDLDPVFQKHIESLFQSLVYSNEPYMNGTNLIRIDEQEIQSRVYKAYTVLTFLCMNKFETVK